MFTIIANIRDRDGYCRMTGKSRERIHYDLSNPIYAQTAVASLAALVPPSFLKVN